MSYLRKIEYEIVLKNSFWIIRNCPKCGRQAHYINTKKFRVDAVMVNIVYCINHIHFICPLFVDFLKAFQSVYQFPYILCYNVLCDFVSLIFSLIRVRNALWEDITQGKR